MRRTLLAGALISAGFAYAQDAGPFVTATRDFLEAVPPAERAESMFEFDSGEREGWHYATHPRLGLSFNDLDEAQRGKLHDVLKTALSEEGYEKLEELRVLEGILFKIRGSEDWETGQNAYHLTVYGDPSPETVWGLRYEGHHISFSWTFADGRVVSSTPQFLGTNPAEVPEGDFAGTHAGWRVLADQEDWGRELLHSLDDAQREAGYDPSQAPAEILSGADRTAAVPEVRGVLYNDLNEEQQALLMRLIRSYCTVQRPDVAEARLDLVHEELDETRFLWIGAEERGDGHYYRIQAPSYMIEFDNTQGNANHVHTVWRDFENDFGRDLLAEHHAKAHRSE